MKLYKVTRINGIGNVEMDIVDESYVVRVEPVYSTIGTDKQKSALTLVYGEHLERFGETIE